MEQNESSYGEIFVRFGQVEAELFVHFFGFKTCRKEKFIFFQLPGSVSDYIVFIFDVAEDFLDQIFQRDDAAGASELVGHDSDRLFLLHEYLHHFLCIH